MGPEKHAILKSVPLAVSTALFQAAISQGLTLEHMVDYALGRRVYARYPAGRLDEAKETFFRRLAGLLPALSAEELTAMNTLAERWPTTPAPPWIVMVAGAGASLRDLDATTATFQRHFGDADLPIRITLRPGLWALARHMGTDTPMRDVEAPKLVEELLDGLDFQAPTAPRKTREAPSAET